MNAENVNGEERMCMNRESVCEQRKYMNGESEHVNAEHVHEPRTCLNGENMPEWRKSV